MTIESAFGRLETGKRFPGKPRGIYVRTGTGWVWGQSSLLFCGFRGWFLRGRGTDKPPPFNVGVKNSWPFTSYLPWRGTKHKGKSAFTLHYYYKFRNYGRDGMEFSVVTYVLTIRL